MSDPGVSHKTRTGAAMGTPLYMSPEQCRGLGVDHRTDIYAFGVMTHEMLTGQLPFDGESMMDLMLKHTTATPPLMSSINPRRCTIRRMAPMPPQLTACVRAAIS